MTHVCTTLHSEFRVPSLGHVQNHVSHILVSKTLVTNNRSTFIISDHSEHSGHSGHLDHSDHSDERMHPELPPQPNNIISQASTSNSLTKINNSRHKLFTTLRQIFTDVILGLTRQSLRSNYAPFDIQ